MTQMEVGVNNYLASNCFFGVELNYTMPSFSREIHGRNNREIAWGHSKGSHQRIRMLEGICKKKKKI